MRENRVSLVWILLLAAAFVIAAVDARASGDRISQSNDMNNQTGEINVDAGSSVEVGGVTVPVTTGSVTQGSVTGGDVNVGGDSHKSYALGMAGLGDVDLNEGRNCMGTEAFSIAVVAKQDMKLNPWCAALFYNANGKHRMAAKARCLLPEILYMSGNDEEQCITDNTFALDGAPPKHTQELLEILQQMQSNDEEEGEAHAAEIAALEERLARSEAKAKKAIVEARYVAQQVQAAQQEIHPEVQQEISDYERRLEKARAAYAGEK